MKLPHLNTFQAIAFTGFITSAVAQAGLLLFSKEVDNFWMVYPVFAGVFLFGTILRYTKLANGHVDHHHHHDHPHDTSVDGTNVS